MSRKKQPRWAKTQYTGISTDKEGNIRVRVSSRRGGQFLERVEVLRKPAEIGEALVVYRRLKEEMLGGAKDLQRITFADYAERWIKNSDRLNRPQVVKTYLNALAYHILPEIGHVYVQDLTREQVIEMTQVWVMKEMPEGGLYAKATIQGWWRVAKAFIADACASYRISFVPTARVRLPPMKKRKKRREGRTLSPRQMAELLDFVERFRPHRYAEMALLVLMGLRPSEIYALLWTDIDLKARVLTVSRSVDHGVLPDEDRQGAKADRSDRDGVDATREVVIPKRAVGALRAHRKAQLASGRKIVIPGLVFPSTTGGYRHASTLRKVYKAAQEYLDLDLKLGNQVLRRTFNTVLEKCTDSITRQALMGHTDIEMTKLYDSVPLERKIAAISKLEALLEGAA